MPLPLYAGHSSRSGARRTSGSVWRGDGTHARSAKSGVSCGPGRGQEDRADTNDAQAKPRGAGQRRAGEAPPGQQRTGGGHPRPPGAKPNGGPGPKTGRKTRSPGAGGARQAEGRRGARRPGSASAPGPKRGPTARTTRPPGRGAARRARARSIQMRPHTSKAGQTRGRYGPGANRQRHQGAPGPAVAGTGGPPGPQLGEPKARMTEGRGSEPPAGRARRAATYT